MNQTSKYCFLVCKDSSNAECRENDFEKCTSDSAYRKACPKSCGLCRGNNCLQFTKGKCFCKPNKNLKNNNMNNAKILKNHIMIYIKD